MPDKPHRSRAGWRDMKDEPGDLVPGMPFHYHRPPKWIARCIVGLFVLGSLNLAGLTMSLIYDVQQQQYILGRGEYRDREAERMQEQAQERDRRTACSILEALPPGPLLDEVREQFSCGPGRPLEEFPEDVQDGLRGNAAPVVPELVQPPRPPRPTLPTPASGEPATHSG